MSEKPRWNLALPVAAALVFGATSVAWVFPREAGSVAGAWLLPALSVVGLLLALRLAADWRWLRGFLVVFALTLILAWIPESATSTAHFAGASLGLLLMLMVARFVETPQRLRFAMLAFLGGGLLVLVGGFTGKNADTLAQFNPVPIAPLPVMNLTLAGVDQGLVNPNALAAAALLIAPLGASILLLRTREKVDRLLLQPLALAVLLTGMLILAVVRSRSTGFAIWVLLVASLVRGPRSLAWKLLAGTVLVAVPFAAVFSVHWIGRDAFAQKAIDLWGNVNDRTQIMTSGVERLKASPWLGIGLNQFRHVYKVPATYAKYDVAHAHNVFLQTALDLGVIGLAAYCCVLVFLLIRADQAAQGSLTLARSAAVGGALSWGAISLFGLTDAVALGAKIGVFQWMAGGLILGAWRLQIESKRRADESAAVTPLELAAPVITLPSVS